ncbi:DUF86 domain-containing protein [candidate division WOR-3 bacterium]|nr:DUF86 domain-containing protein [candidate division WOR-3 bacterium]MCK4527003.1 DUF86 domain-containing protein [candidate division WOR-3 bacterium]
MDKDKINQQLDILNEELKHLSSKKDIPLKEYLTNKEIQYFIERAFQKAIESCINIGNHIIARKHLGHVGSFSEVFRILG